MTITRSSERASPTCSLTEEMQVIGQVASLTAGTLFATTIDADVLVVDVFLGDGLGLDLVRAMRALRPQLGVVVLTMHSDDETLLAALDAGASSLVSKTRP